MLDLCLRDMPKGFKACKFQNHLQQIFAIPWFTLELNFSAGMNRRFHGLRNSCCISKSGLDTFFVKEKLCRCEDSEITIIYFTFTMLQRSTKGQSNMNYTIQKSGKKHLNYLDDMKLHHSKAEKKLETIYPAIRQMIFINLKAAIK